MCDTGRLLPDSREHGTGIRSLLSLRTSYAPIFTKVLLVWVDRGSLESTYGVGSRCSRKPVLYCHEHDCDPDSDERRGRLLVSHEQGPASRCRLATIAAAETSNTRI
jgi:hypothetical protein